MKNSLKQARKSRKEKDLERYQMTIEDLPTEAALIVKKKG